MATKRKVTVTLDEALLESLAVGGSVSSQLNDAGWTLIEARQRAARLAALLDAFDAEDGPLPIDVEEDARLERLLGGAA